MNNYIVLGEYGIQSDEYVRLEMRAKNEANVRKNFLKRIRSGEFGYISVDRIVNNIRIELK